MTESQADPDPAPPRRALPVTITPGMPVVETADAMPATIVGITEAWCIYRLAQTGTLGVAPWREMALAGVCPAEPLLPGSIDERDRRNASAALLRELLALRHFGLSPTQSAALEELLAQLCGGAPAVS